MSIAWKFKYTQSFCINTHLIYVWRNVGPVYMDLGNEKYICVRLYFSAELIRCCSGGDMNPKPCGHVLPCAAPSASHVYDRIVQAQIQYGPIQYSEPRGLTNTLSRVAYGEPPDPCAYISRSRYAPPPPIPPISARACMKSSCRPPCTIPVHCLRAP